jgi:exoribonuclease II
VQANLLAATATSEEATAQAYNVGCGEETSLMEETLNWYAAQLLSLDSEAAATR